MHSALYATTDGRFVRLKFDGRHRASRRGGMLDGVDFCFSTDVNGAQGDASVYISGQKYSALEHWLKSNGQSADEDSVIPRLRDICASKLLQAFDQYLDFEADFAAFPESFLMVTEVDLSRFQNPGKAAPAVIRDYISRRLHAAWAEGTASEGAIAFGRVDALYLNTSVESIQRVINLYNGDLWTKETGSPRVTPKSNLLREYVERFSNGGPPAPSRAAGAPPSDTSIRAIFDSIQSRRVDLAAWLRQFGSKSTPDLSTNRSNKTRWDVALSFAGENREYVEAVARALREHDVSAFYDADEAVDLWGKNLSEYLPEIYMNLSRIVVLFVSRPYADKEWTRLERRSAMARALREKLEYVLPVRFDDTELPGLLPTISYLDARRIEPDELAARIAQKLQMLGK